MTPYPLNGKEIAIVVVPEGATGICFEHSNDFALRYYPRNYNDVHDSRRIELPSQGWQLLGPGTMDQIPESEAAKVVEKLIIETSRVPIWKYKNYKGGIKFNYATESLESFVRSKGYTEPSNQIVIIIKEKV